MALRLLERGEEPRLGLRGARRAEEEHAALRSAVEQVTDEVDRGRVGPMQVVEREHERRVLPDAREQQPQGA